METKRKKGRFRIICDEVKLQQTPHWDMDCMTREQLDEVFGVADDKTPEAPRRKRGPDDADGDGD
ncbi:MAG: hypothetical protein H2060_00280 [Azoarcus sp.]|nr:hypothetical protein [Azoarcus sp.]